MQSIAILRIILINTDVYHEMRVVRVVVESRVDWQNQEQIIVE